MYAEHDVAMWGRIIIGEHAREQSAQGADRAIVIPPGENGVPRRERSFHHDAPPVEHSLDFICLERAPLMVRQRQQLRPHARPPEDPGRFVDKVDRLDVDPIAVGERNPADGVAGKKRLRLVARQRPDRRLGVDDHLPLTCKNRSFTPDEWLYA